MARDDSETAASTDVESMLSIKHGYNIVKQVIDPWLLFWSDGEWERCSKDLTQMPETPNFDFIHGPEPEPSPPSSPIPANCNVAEDTAFPLAPLSSVWYNVAYQPVLESKPRVIFPHEGDVSPTETAGSEWHEHRYEPAPELEPQKSPSMMKLNPVGSARSISSSSTCCSALETREILMEGSPQLKLVSLARPICSSSTPSSSSDAYKDEATFQKNNWNSESAWRFCSVWEDTGPSPPIVASSCVQKEPVILCCAQQDRWWPVSVERASVVGSQGHALKLMNDYSDLFAITVENSADGDPTHMSLRSADRSHYLSCIEKQLCEDSKFLGVAGPLETLQARPASPDNRYCFHLYASSGMTGEGSAMLPICFDEVNHCLVLAESATGCEPAVLALQTVSSAHLLQEIIDLTHDCLKQDFCVSGLNNLLKMQMFAYRDILNEHSPELQKQCNRRDAEEERLLFLQDNLDFAREQLRSILADAGAGAAHGLPEACMLDSEGYPSWKCEQTSLLSNSLHSILGRHGRGDA